MATVAFLALFPAPSGASLAYLSLLHWPLWLSSNAQAFPGLVWDVRLQMSSRLNLISPGP